MKKSGIRVIVVEDDPDLRESLVEGLTLSGHDTLGVGTGLEFYKALHEHSYSVAVLDVGLPDEDGYTLAEFARRKTAMGIIILTARGAIEERIRGYDSGADLYFVKPVDCRELAAAIGSLVLRQPAGTESASREGAPSGGGWRLDGNAWAMVTPGGTAVALTAKEFEFLRCLAVSPGETVARQDLTERLYGRYDEHTSRSLDSLVRRLRAKFPESGGETLPIKTAHAIGYCFSAPLES